MNKIGCRSMQCQLAVLMMKSIMLCLLFNLLKAILSVKDSFLLILQPLRIIEKLLTGLLQLKELKLKPALEQRMYMYF
jgi:hypothetical protein